MMKHYDDSDWIDFARKMLAPQKMDEMRSHLDSGCATCAEEARLWTWMRGFGTKEAAYQPPESAVRIAKAAFAGNIQEPRNIMREIAELVFDTYAQPQVVGIRSTAAAPRQLLYRAGPIMIDMRLQMVADEERFALMGQVLTSGEKKHAMRQVPIHLLSGTDELAATSTNQFGEFYLEHKAGRDLQVSLQVSDEKSVFIPLDESIWRVARGQ
jgi:hypothetical protein